MKNFKIAIVVFSLLLLGSARAVNIRTYAVRNFGLEPNTKKNTAVVLSQLIKRIKKEAKRGDSIVIKFEKGNYLFNEKGATTRVYYISNHDQDNPKKIGMDIEGIDHLCVEGNGAHFLFEGRMIPIAITHSSYTTLKDFSIDFLVPQICQIKIIENSPKKGITFETAPWVQFRMNKKGYFEHYGKGWSLVPTSGIAFDGKSRHIVFNTSDLFYSTQGAQQVGERKVYAPQWKDARLTPGTVIAMRGWERPAPGIFLSENKNTVVENIKVHYAEGMGLLAQMCENISLNHFGVCLKGKEDSRYFTTQADATHFSGCKGVITSTHGLYEGMMDDAINVHGTYLKVVKRMGKHQFVGRYMHAQTYGFKWGEVGDTLQFILPQTMELIGEKVKITEIVPYLHPQTSGTKEFLITIAGTLPSDGDAQELGVENLTWTPSVYFADNTIRNNRARGALFSTPKPVVVENNFFDHTSGSAILLCGDCNGWYETGACRQVVIRKNHFKNALTNLFQFTNAVISIYPEIPDLAHQKKFFHGGQPGSITIEDNLFETFDAPIVYAKSVDGLRIVHNTIVTNHDFPAFHKNHYRYTLEHTGRVEIY